MFAFGVFPFGNKRKPGGHECFPPVIRGGRPTLYGDYSIAIDAVSRKRFPPYNLGMMDNFSIARIYDVFQLFFVSKHGHARGSICDGSALTVIYNIGVRVAGVATHGRCGKYWVYLLLPRVFLFRYKMLFETLRSRQLMGCHSEDASPLGMEKISC